MELFFKEVGEDINTLERKIDGTRTELEAQQQQLLQMRQQQMDQPGPGGKVGAAVGDVRAMLKEELGPLQATLVKEFQSLKMLLKDHRSEHDRRQTNLSQEHEAKFGAPNSFRSFRLDQPPTEYRLQVASSEMDEAPLPTITTVELMPRTEAGLQPRSEEEDAAKSGTPSTEADTQEDAAKATRMPANRMSINSCDEDEVPEDLHKTIELRESSGLASVFSSDDDVENPPYHVEDFYFTEGICQKIARSNFFANFTVFVVSFNAVYIGVDSDYNDSQNIYEADLGFQICSQFFCVYFTWELVVRLLAFEHKPDCMKDGWFKFDAFLVSTMILDTWVLMPVLFSMGGAVTIPTQPLRMLRLFKLTRMARLMKAFPELVTMIKGLVRSLRAISSSMILIGLMVYVWAIMMHMLMKEEYEFNAKLEEDQVGSFATICKCMWILLMDGTLMLDNAAPLMTTLLFSHKVHYVLAGNAFIWYALLSAMLILQMLIGVLCDVVSRVGQEQRDSVAIGLVKQELLIDLRRHDGGDGKITQEELLKIMRNPRSKALLQKLNINRGFFLELQSMMFDKKKGGVQEVHIKEVLELMVMCRGDNNTTVHTMAASFLSIIKQVKECKHMLEDWRGDLHDPSSALSPSAYRVSASALSFDKDK